MTKNQFMNILAAIESNFETKAKTEMALDLWYENLKDIEYGLCQQAVNNMYKNHKSSFVNVADIRRACDDILDPKVNIVEAMQALTDTIRLYGRYQHQKAMEVIEKKNPHMHKVVKAIGYQSLCNCDMQFTRGPIERMYKAVAMDSTNVNLLGNYSKEISEVKSIALKGMGE